ncbi:hypothetical protein PMI10_00863 [Flavobacterium sp. CF136]|nr:hypothetical protein PMI10_00863 [Flavobacterium sp. CF136]
MNISEQNMEKSLKKIILYLRIAGTASLIVFFIMQLLNNNNNIKNYVLYFSAACFGLILISGLIRYLKNNYFKE